jgi:tetratricopeptide (TPR) repeat protein
MRLWGDTLQGARDYFWTGSGVGTFAFAFRRPAMYLPLKTIDHAHSDYLEALVELGVPAGLFLIGILAFFWARTAWRIAEAGSHRRRMLAMGCWLGASGILLHAAVDFPLRIPAVAALAAVLAGLASGLSASRQRQRPLVRFAAGAEAAVFLALSLGLLLGAAEDKNAETLFALGSAAMADGQWEEAERLYRRALEANPFAAAVWLKRAEIAELQGDRRGALEMATLAQRLEPHTLRVEWPLAHLYLRGGDFEKAAVPLNRLATGLPSSRAAVFEAAWRAGMDPSTIARSAVPRNGEAIGEYLCYLVRKSAWREIVLAYQELNPEGTHEVPAKLLQYTFDKLFAAGANREGEQLQQLVQRSDWAQASSTP